MYTQALTHRLLAASLAAILLAIAAGHEVLADDSEASDYLFYPLPPDLPRLQFLTSFSSPLDVSAGKSAFRR